VLFDVLRHRIILSFEAEAAGIDQDRVIQRVLDVVAVAWCASRPCGRCAG